VLSNLDPEHRSAYQDNARRYREELSKLDGWIRDVTGSIPADQRVLVLDHLVLGYFADRYGFEMSGAIVPAFSSAAEPSARELAALSEVIITEGVPAIFVGADSNAALSVQIAGDLGIEVVQLYTGSLGPVGGPAGTYLGLMQYNVLAIQQALSP
jgi:ABC-type Zn uptake system ZnuABC Zn-binding protein ZnuA